MKKIIYLHKRKLFMNRMSLEILDQLEKTEWFQQVGRVESADVIVVSSWAAVIASFSSYDWEDLRLDATNDFRVSIFRFSRERLDNWNVVVRQLMPVIMDLISRKTEKVIEENKLPKKFIDIVNWDILGVFLEAEYSDIIAPNFYVTLLYPWCLRGHFPCGWEGAYPSGKLIVY